MSKVMFFPKVNGIVHAMWGTLYPEVRSLIGLEGSRIQEVRDQEPHQAPLASG
jgi:hypothetical protein